MLPCAQWGVRHIRPQRLNRLNMFVGPKELGDLALTYYEGKSEQLKVSLYQKE